MSGGAAASQSKILSVSEIAEMRERHGKAEAALMRLFGGKTMKELDTVDAPVEGAYRKMWKALGSPVRTQRESARSGAEPIFDANRLWSEYDAESTPEKKAEKLKEIQLKDRNIQSLAIQIDAAKKAKDKLKHHLYLHTDSRSAKEQVEQHNERGMTVMPDGLRIAGLGGSPSARAQWFNNLHERLDPLGLMDFIATLLEIFTSGNKNPDQIMVQELIKARDQLNQAEGAKDGKGRRFDVALEADGDFTLICRSEDKTTGKFTVPETLSEAERFDIERRINQGLADVVKHEKSGWYEGLSVKMGSSTFSTADMDTAADADVKAGAEAETVHPSAPPAPGAGPATTLHRGSSASTLNPESISVSEDSEEEEEEHRTLG